MDNIGDFLFKLPRYKTQWSHADTGSASTVQHGAHSSKRWSYQRNTDTHRKS